MTWFATRMPLRCGDVQDPGSRRQHRLRDGVRQHSSGPVRRRGVDALIGYLHLWSGISGRPVKNMLRSACAQMTLVMVGLALPATAQGRGPDLSLGYQYQWVPAGGIPAGFTVDVSAPLGTGVNVVGQFDWSRKSEAEIEVATTQTVSTFVGGLRWSRQRPSIEPFLQFLAGMTRNSLHTTFSTNNVPQLAGLTFDSGGTLATLQVGGGFAMSLNGRISAVGEVDYRPYIHSRGSWSHSARAVAGVRINLK